MAGKYTYNDFLTAANQSGLMGEFSQEDLNLAQQYPEFGLSILSLKKDYHAATTDEARMLANTAANAIRSSYGNYRANQSGTGYYSEGKIPGQIDDTLDRIAGYGSFTYDKEAPVYENEYAKQQKRLLDAILNREDFSWSKETDPLYGTYKKSYLREGQRATADALGQAAAASGGRPSSYAVTAATQAGDYYAAKLNDIIPTLYQQAYQKYMDDYSMKLQDLGAVNTQEQMAYQKYLDQLGQFNTDRGLAYQQYLDQFSQLQGKLSALQGQDATDYARYLDKVNLGIQEEQRQYQRTQAERELAIQQVSDILKAGGTPSQELLAAAGLTDEYAQGVHAGWQRDQDKATQDQDRAFAQAQVDAMLKNGGTPSADLIAASGYSNEYVQALVAAWQREQAEKAAAAKAKASSSSGSSGSASGSKTTGDTTGTAAIQAIIDKFNAGDHGDEVIKALVEDGYTEKDLKEAGYTGNYFSTPASGEIQLSKAAQDILQTRVNPGTKADVAAYFESRIKQALSNGSITQAEADYLRQKIGITSASTTSTTGSGGTTSPKPSTAAGSIASQVTNRVDTRNGGTDWIVVPGYSRVTWVELESMVNRGEVLETYDPATGKYTYKKNPNYKKSTGGTSTR